jgi:hypothetical protein
VLHDRELVEDLVLVHFELTRVSNESSSSQENRTLKSSEEDEEESAADQALIDLCPGRSIGGVVQHRRVLEERTLLVLRKYYSEKGEEKEGSRENEMVGGKEKGTANKNFMEAM